MKQGKGMVNNTESNGNTKYMEDGTAPALPHHGDSLVSAIITTHNREPGMVLRAVNSVLNQTYQNIELIVVDDSSPSFAQRAEVEQSVRSISDHILYLKHEVCQGACAARNTGLSRAKGYYVSFLDDDDEWMPTKIEEQLKGFCDDNTALVFGNCIIIDEKANIKSISRFRGESGYLFEPLLKRNIIGPTSNPLIKRESIEMVGGFDVQMESCQDYDLWLRLGLRYPMQYIDAPVLRYHVHPENRISTDDIKRINGIERLFSKYASYFSNDNEAWYYRRIMLIPHYLKQFGRKNAFAIWISCIKKRPECFLRNFMMLVRIIMGNDLYVAIRNWRAVK